MIDSNGVIVIDFNSRPREGANDTAVGTTMQQNIISIPAPARGRTMARPALVEFNGFQVPPPRGGEPFCIPHLLKQPDFNSRPREGANPCATAYLQIMLIFQFPPPRGGEPTDCTVDSSIIISIPAPARGRTSAG